VVRVAKVRGMGVAKHFAYDELQRKAFQAAQQAVQRAMEEFVGLQRQAVQRAVEVFVGRALVMAGRHMDACSMQPLLQELWA